MIYSDNIMMNQKINNGKDFVVVIRYISNTNEFSLIIDNLLHSRKVFTYQPKPNNLKFDVGIGPSFDYIDFPGTLSCLSYSTKKFEFNKVLGIDELYIEELIKLSNPSMSSNFD